MEKDKIPVNKSATCTNLEGLLNYEIFFVREMLDKNPQYDMDVFEDNAIQSRELYCGTMCFNRYGCKIAERYLK